MAKFRVQVIGREREDSERWTHVELWVDYWKEFKQVYLHVQPIKVESGMVMMELMTGRRITLEPMGRLNRNRVSELTEDVKFQVAEKRGPAWDLLEQARAAHGLLLANYRATSCEVA